MSRDKVGWIEIKWNEMKWIELNWIELNWIKMYCIVLDYIRLTQFTILLSKTTWPICAWRIPSPLHSIFFKEGRSIQINANHPTKSYFAWRACFSRYELHQSLLFDDLSNHPALCDKRWQSIRYVIWANLKVILMLPKESYYWRLHHDNR